MLRLIRPTLLLICATTLLGGCDDGSDVPADEFRDGTVCLVGITPPSTKVIKNGMPHPDDTKTLLFKLAEEQVDQFMISYASLEIDLEAECKTICAVDDYDWGGEICIGKRDYTYGDVETYKTATGEPRYRIPVKTGSTDVGCACG